MKVSKMNRKSLSQEVYELLLNYILSGTVIAGSRLDENELANQFGISRTPLREAINRLIQQGLVTEVPFKGNFVKKFSSEEVKEIYEVRKVLEAMSTRLAVQNMKDENITELSEIVEQIKFEQQKGEVLNFSKLDDKFHMYIADCSGNSTLVHLIMQLEKKIQMVKIMGNTNNEIADLADSDRNLIMEAIIKRDADLAAHYMELHIENASKGVVALISKITN